MDKRCWMSIASLSICPNYLTSNLSLIVVLRLMNIVISFWRKNLLVLHCFLILSYDMSVLKHPLRPYTFLYSLFLCFGMMRAKIGGGGACPAKAMLQIDKRWHWMLGLLTSPLFDGPMPRQPWLSINHVHASEGQMHVSKLWSQEQWVTRVRSIIELNTWL
jgi:hypothetical protein